MTYLEIVNNVLRRLREDTVSTVNETEYSALVGVLVNDAKRLVENSNDWTALKVEQLVNTYADNSDYSLTDCGHGVKIFDAYNVTSKIRLNQQSDAWMRHQRLVGANATDYPANFTVQSVDSNGDAVIRLYPTPDAVYNLNLRVIKQQDDLSTDADVVLVPWLPVAAYATAMAIAERGEQGGVSAQEQYMIAKNLLGDAIAYDLNTHPEELVFMAV